MQKAANHFDTYHISIKDGKVFPGNEQEELSYLMEDFARWLPDMTLHVSIHDMGPHLMEMTSGLRSTVCWPPENVS